MAPQAQPGRGFSITGLVLGILSIILAVWFGFILGVLAIIFSALALRKYKNGMAIAGLVTGIVGTALGFLFGAAIFFSVLAGLQEKATNSSYVESVIVA